MYNKRFNKSNNRFKDKKQFNKNRNKVEIPQPTDAAKPVEEKQVSPLFKKPLSGLPLGASITVKSDPYAIVLPGSKPYALADAMAPRVGGKYGGKQNLDGGVTQQLLTSNASVFLHTYDSMLLRCRVNYKYLPIKSSDTGRGSGLIFQMQQAIDEIISIAKSTTYTNLAINEYSIKSTLPGLNNYTTGEAVSCGTAKGLYALLIGYQTILQSIASAFNMYNKFRANQGVMIDMSWNRETPRLNSWFSLANKSSVVNQWKSLAYVLNGEYFDAAWMAQFNMIGSLTSRKSEAMLDPILEVCCTHNLPSFKLLLNDKTVFDTADLDAIVAASLNAQVAETKTLQGMLDKLSISLSINDNLYWVRNPDNYAQNTEQSKLGFLTNVVSTLIAVSSAFKPAMGDLRTMLDVLARTSVVKWNKNTQLAIFDNLYIKPQYNLTVQDLYRTLLSGADEVKWHDETKRWQLLTPWHYYEGIPEYDNMSGGIFLSLCTKTIKADTDTSGHAKDYLPILISDFIPASTELGRAGYVFIINRLGESRTLAVGTGEKAVSITANKGLIRLMPLKGADFKVRVPYCIDDIAQNTVDGKLEKSFLNYAVMKVLGVFSYNNTATVDNATDLSVDPDFTCFLPVEVDDLQNEMITFCRTEGPFDVNPGMKSSIGFIGLV